MQPDLDVACTRAPLTEAVGVGDQHPPPGDAKHLGDDPARVRDVVEHSGRHDDVHGRVVEGQLLTATGEQVDAPLGGSGAHCLDRLNPRHAEIRATGGEELDGPAGPGTDVQDRAGAQNAKEAQRVLERNVVLVARGEVLVVRVGTVGVISRLLLFSAAHTVILPDGPEDKRYPIMRAPRVVFLALETDTSAATRAHCQLPASLLRASGVDAVVLTPPSGSARMAFTPRARHLKAAYAALVVLPLVLVNVARACRADVVVVQRAIFRYDAPPVLERLLGRELRRRGATLVLNLDDALYTVRRESYETRMRTADLVSTGNDAIATYAEALGRPTFRYPGAVEVSKYRPNPHRQRREAPIIVGWSGSQPQQDLSTLAPVLERLCVLRPQVRVRVVSRQPYRLPGPRIRQEWAPWRPHGRYQYLSEFDIGVMPLEDTPYNRAKEGYKLKEYMASAVPSVSSPVGHNYVVVVDGVTGFFARDPDEWLQRLLQLVDSVDLRRQMGRAARQEAEQRWDVPALEPYVRKLLALGGTA